MYRSEDSIKIAVREIWWKGVDWIHLTEARDRWRVLLDAVVFRRVRKIGGFLE